MPQILFVLTSHGQLGKTREITGFHLAEAARPYWILKDQGFEIDFASPLGGHAPMDHVELEDADNSRFLENTETRRKLEATFSPEEIDPGHYDAIYFVGGHGTMWDFPDNQVLQGLTARIWEQGGIVAAICHGPAALVNVRLPDGRFLVEGKRVNCFTDEEERAGKKDKIVPFLLESKLRERGALICKSPPQQCHVEIDGRLITGQNPASAHALGEAIAEALSRSGKHLYNLALR